ncbi:PAS domain-containing protein [Lysobacter sp. MMG2]|uniref:PAS domain-containing protein n=1 Tax=Lysobacter sp. MMG2 TaxID=2801338 RepID=UPI001C22F921|nr:PAS domain-containing protein [Lysobacter sp. MMG2]MBU8977760.1 PAS domain-containing protein [Lysobacter sp. MMG2]
MDKTAAGARRVAEMTHTGQDILAGGGQMGERLRDMDWSNTALGPVETWPEALRTLVQLMLASNQPTYIIWGQARSFLYNDHYMPFLGAKHPAAIGRDILEEVWPEIRSELEPLIDAVASGDPVHVPSMRLMLERNGYPEETYFSFFFAPVRDASGSVAGMFGVCSDITAKMRLERDLTTSDARHRQVLTNMDEAFVLLDRDFHVVEVNPVAERLTQLSRDELVGRLHWDLFPGTLESPIGEMYVRAQATSRPEVSSIATRSAMDGTAGSTSVHFLSRKGWRCSSTTSRSGAKRRRQPRSRPSVFSWPWMPAQFSERGCGRFRRTV